MRARVYVCVCVCGAVVTRASVCVHARTFQRHVARRNDLGERRSWVNSKEEGPVVPVDGKGRTNWHWRRTRIRDRMLRYVRTYVRTRGVVRLER